MEKRQRLHSVGGGPVFERARRPMASPSPLEGHKARLHAAVIALRRRARSKISDPVGRLSVSGKA